MQFNLFIRRKFPVRVSDFQIGKAVKPDLFFLWVGAFIYSLVLALTLQKLVLPLIPSMHAGHGLMLDDAINFHENAVAMAESIRAKGWSAWELMPFGRYTANVGILAAVYALFIPEPALFLPLTAAFHALGALAVVLLASLILPASNTVRNGLFSSFLFLAFPSALVWYGQNHKDAFLIAGYLLSLYSFLQSLNRTSFRQLWKDALVMFLGLSLVAIMRPHMVIIYTVAFGCALSAIFVWRLIRPNAIQSVSFRNALIMLAVGCVVAWCSPVENQMVTWEVGNSQGVVAPSMMRLDGWKWERSEVIPAPFDRALQKISAIRVHFINSGELVGAGSLIDSDVKPRNALEVVLYLPRAALVGVFSPFPSFWVERLSLPRVVGSVETLIFYIIFPGIFILLVRRPSKELIACLIASVAVITVLSFVSPNIGTLHRVRYGQLFVLVLAGCAGWGLLLRDWVERSGYSIASLGNYKGRSGSDISEVSIPSGVKAFGAGLIVTLVTMLGLLGLLIRDLMLINRSGFGESLDSYYMAIMLPMLFISVLSAPLGDALTSRFLKFRVREDIQSLLGAISGFTLIVFSVMSIVTVFFADEIFSVFSAAENVDSITVLFPIALLLFVFSGVIVAGNSLVNSLGKPVLSAVAQLSVPLIVIVAILISDDYQLVRSAIIGMAVGQLVNLMILYAIVSRCGFKLMPASMSVLWLEKGILTDCKWLVFCAFLSSLIIPINYWFAGNVGVGSVSTWAIGSKLVQMSSLIGAALMTAVFVPYMTNLVSAGITSRIRNSLFVSLVVGSWGSAVVIAIVFVFAEPLVFSAVSSVNDETVAMQLVGILKLGALQLPYVITTILLVKLCAVSAVSRKAVAAALVGLTVNIILNFVLAPTLGVLGLAAAWTASSILSTVLIMVFTRKQSHLSLVELSSISVTWLVLFCFALGMHLQSALIVLGTMIVAVMIFYMQFKMFSNSRDAVGC
jgi:putative peptidoglycan lipid II flippase